MSGNGPANNSAALPSCAGACPIFDSPAVLGAARAVPDSLDASIELASVTLRGRAGDTVAVVLTADAGVLAAIPSEERLTVSDGTSSRAISLADALGGAVIYRFDHADSVVLEYTINRRIVSPPSGTAVLVQTTSAITLAMRTAWVSSAGQAGAARLKPAAGRSGTIAAAATPTCSSSPTFDVAASGDYCGTSVVFSTVFPAAAFLSKGAEFQNAISTGLSHPITIQFSPAVNSVQVTAYDPTFDGNRMEAFDALGNSIGAADFPGNHRPGVFTSQTRTLSGHIASIVLTPAANEYVAYSMLVTPTPPPPTVTMNCGSPVIRGTSTTCQLVATPADPPITVTGWYFIPDDRSLAERVDRTSDQDSFSWSGVMAAGGTVHATWTFGGAPEVHDVSASVAVLARNWAGKTIVFPELKATDDPDMVEQPFQRPGEEGFYHLGHFEANWVPDVLDPNTTLGVINSGPNSGYFYLTGIPMRSNWVVHINYSQLTTTSDLARIQLENRPVIGTGCTRTDLPRFVKPTEVHEGIGLDPLSHGGRTKSKFGELAGPAFEPLVWGPKSSDFKPTLEPVENSLIARVAIEAAKADDDFKVRAPCTIKLFNPPVGSFNQ